MSDKKGNDPLCHTHTHTHIYSICLKVANHSNNVHLFSS